MMRAKGEKISRGRLEAGGVVEYTEWADSWYIFIIFRKLSAFIFQVK